MHHYVIAVSIYYRYVCAKCLIIFHRIIQICSISFSIMLLLSKKDNTSSTRLVIPSVEVCYKTGLYNIVHSIIHRIRFMYVLPHCIAAIIYHAIVAGNLLAVFHFSKICLWFWLCCNTRYIAVTKRVVKHFCFNEIFYWKTNIWNLVGTNV